MSFASPLQLATYFDGTTVLANLTPAWVSQATILLDMISADIEIAAGVPLKAGAVTAVIAGTWNRDLLLPRGPVRTITAVTLNNTALTAAEYKWNDRDLFRRGSGDILGDGFDFDNDYSPLSGQGAAARSGGNWGGPSSTVRIEYTAGFAAVPTWATSLALRIAARTFGNVSDITQESLAIYSVTYRGDRGSGNSGDSGSHVTDGERRRLRKIVNRTGGTFETRAR